MKSDEAGKHEVTTSPASPPEDTTSISRREWFRRLGSAALAAGLPGALIGGAASAMPEIDALQGVALPAGLYTPSSECLGRALESDERFHPIPPGSETDYVRRPAGPFRPAFFTQEDFPVLRRLVELLLGLQEGEAEGVSQWIDLCVASAAGAREAARALSSAHRAVAVAYFGDVTAVHRLETDHPEPIFREGLQWVERESLETHGAKFIALNEAQQLEIMKAISDDRPEKDAGNAGKRFFKLLKYEAINGYYTSRTGLRELDCQGNQFHATSPACNLPLKTG